ncbi:transcription factor [Candida orthopsilosis Co 90-125]|uniref:Transcription factor n=1 Tax=Candida orthopsilosis (strain 90-125) TaxID=1136231 RepID=H8X044_CANO9|nr:transcription factor [Candida orthopsilosis Co 90-125]CCG22556.1 transcription factor [Candida orthopsilosis Co 90-125]
MGNVPTKEARSRSNSNVSDFHNGGGSSSNTFTTNGSSSSSSNGRHSKHLRKGSSLTGLVNGHQRSTSSDLRKAKRQEEKDQKQYHHYSQLIVKLDENVDGGFLAPYGTYKSNLDFDTDIVRSLIVNRELSPFFTPLQDYDQSWTDDELCILLSQLPLHALEEPTELNGFEEEEDADSHKIHKSANYYKRQEEKAKLKSLISRMKEIQKDAEQRYIDSKGKSKQIPSRDLLLRLYRNPSECPICFLYYPKHLNVSRCCLQPICTECFVQIKRLDPHPPHDDPSNHQAGEQPHSLISEPASCPYCAMPEFGVTYDPPLDIHTGIGGILPGDYKATSAILEDEEGGVTNDNDEAVADDDDSASSPSPVRSNRKSIGSPIPTSPPPPNSMQNKLWPQKKKGKQRTRRSSVAANAPGVITIDKIRPNWEQTLNSARNKLARRAATASAIHASNLIINDGEGEGSGSNKGNSNSRVRSSTMGSSSYDATDYSLVEQQMINEAMRLSLLDEEERKRKAERDQK